VPEHPTTIETPAGHVHAVWHDPGEHGPADIVLVLAHGAGGSLKTPQIARFAAALAGRGIGAVRFNFPYVERGRKTPGSPKEAIAAYAAVADAARRRSTGKLFVGGKSYGGRMASHLVAEGYAADGLVFLGYPLHAPATPDRLRDEHLHAIAAPMLFLQGTRDAFARRDLIEAVTKRLPASTLHLVEGADHSFAVSGRKPDDVVDELAGVTADWIERAR
jgi:hypothetical protein